MERQQSSITGEWIRNKDEQEIAEARMSPDILCTLDKEGLDKLTELLTKWVIYVGVSKVSEQEFSVISKYLIRSFPRLTLQEIDLAIELSVSHIFEVEKLQPYIFCPLYIGSVLRPFIRYRNIVLGQILENKKHYIEEQRLKYRSSPEYICVLTKNMLLLQYQVVISGGEITDLYNVGFNFLWASKRIAINEDLKNRALEYAKGKIEMGDETHTGVLIRIIENPEDVAKMYARNYCLMEYYRTVNINQLLDSIREDEFVTNT